MVTGQDVALDPRTPKTDRDPLVSETTRSDADAEDLVVRRTTTQPVRSIKVRWPRTLIPQFLGHVSHIR